jgi:hypothetical protein
MGRNIMATVWAYRNEPQFKTRENKATGYSVIFEFNSLSHLVIKLENLKLKSSVTRLSIINHGDKPGLIRTLEPGIDLTPLTFDHFRDDFQNLNLYLTAKAELCFFSCIAGADEEGSKLLIRISKLLPGRTIIGFDTKAAFAPDSDPGAAFVGDGIFVTEKKPIDIYGTCAKHARDGIIRRLPKKERMKLNQRCDNPKCKGDHLPEGLFPPGKLPSHEKRKPRPCPGFTYRENVCANPKCPGHKKIEDACDDWH